MKPKIRRCLPSSRWNIDAFGDEDMVAASHEVSRCPTRPGGIMRTAQTTTLSIHGLVSTSKTTGSKVGVHVAYGGIRKGGARPKEGSITMRMYVHIYLYTCVIIMILTWWNMFDSRCLRRSRDCRKHGWMGQVDLLDLEPPSKDCDSNHPGIYNKNCWKKPLHVGKRSSGWQGQPRNVQTY